MKLNISYPATGCQKLIEIDDEKRLRPLYEKRMASEVQAECLGDEWKGYVLRITGGNDKQGFPMKQGVLTTGRVKLLLGKGMSCFRPRRKGQRRRKSVRGCIVDGNLSVLALKIVKKGENEIPGLTDKTIPRRLGPKRASKIRKLFNLSKEDDVRQYVVRRPLPVKEDKKRKKKTTAPKIQRLVTPLVLQRKRHKIAMKRKRAVRRREEAAEYAKLLALRLKQARNRKRSRSRSRSSTSKSESKSESESKPVVKAQPKTKSASSGGAKGAAKGAAKAAKAGAKTPTKPGAKGAAKPGTKAGSAKSGATGSAKAAPKSGAKAAAKSSTKSAGKPGSKSGAKAGAKSSGKSGSKGSKK